MTLRSRAVRVVLPGAGGQLAETPVEVVNVSRTGALIRSGYELWPGALWPFVLELQTEAVNLTARVVRCRPTDGPSHGGALRTQYDIGITFDLPSAAARRLLQQLCGAAVEPADHDSPSEAGAPVGGAMTQAERPKPKRVLVVDDEDLVRQLLAKVLGDAGYGVALAADGPEALRMAQHEGPFDLCIVDLMMPSMNGDEVARRLRRVDPDVKVLYCTGYSDQLFLHVPVLELNEAFVDKPVAIEGLLEAVSLLLFGRIRRLTP